MVLDDMGLQENSLEYQSSLYQPHKYYYNRKNHS